MTTANPPAGGQRERSAMSIPGSTEILGYAHRLGWSRTLARGLYVAANQLATVSILDCFHLRREDINTALTNAGGQYECRFLAPPEMIPVADRCEAPLNRILHEAVARGDAAYAIFDGPRLASIGLYAERPTPIMTDLVVSFDPPERYMYRGYTLPDYRGQRLHALGILRAALELFDRDVPQLVTVCERTNYPATISVLRMGWQPSGTIYRVGIGPWVRLGQTARARSIGMHLRRRDANSADRSDSRQVHEAT
jgi:hypothetical protein